MNANSIKYLGLLVLWLPLLNAMEAEQMPEKNLERNVVELRQAYKTRRSASFNVNLSNPQTAQVYGKNFNATEIALRILSLNIKQLSEQHLKTLSRTGSQESDIMGKSETEDPNTIDSNS